MKEEEEEEDWFEEAYWTLLLCIKITALIQ
jgi:hypothetical protein